MSVTSGNSSGTCAREGTENGSDLWGALSKFLTTRASDCCSVALASFWTLQEHENARSKQVFPAVIRVSVSEWAVSESCSASVTCLLGHMFTGVLFSDTPY